MSETYKVAAFQMDCKLGQTEQNADRIITILHDAKRQNVRLVVFPECALSGYCVNSVEETAQVAIPIHDPNIQRIVDACKELSIYACVGYTENRNGKRYNSAFLAGPEGRILSNYSKMHLPYVGADKFVEKGQPPEPPVQTEIGSLSTIICYDVRFPELTRYYGLNGADIMMHPTNWPLGSEGTREILPVARAFENMMFWIACNRVGDENGSHFIGGSRIISPGGKVLAQAGEDGEELIIAEIDPAAARRKSFYSVEGDWSIDIIGDRRPEVFGNQELVC